LLRRLYDWTIEMAGRPQAMPALAAVSFAESSFFPVPPDVMLVPMVLRRRDKAWRIAAVCTIASVLGGLLGYAIGNVLYAGFGERVIALYGLQQRFLDFQETLSQWGFLLILAKGLTPIPFKLVTIACGVGGYNLGLFVLASVITRGARFFLEAALLKHYGEPIRTFLERYLTWITTAVLVAIVLGFVILKYI
jgi:membrane protein YqaA with SNARE-associated domain